MVVSATPSTPPCTPGRRCGALPSRPSVSRAMMTSGDPATGLTYRTAGVDIDAGEALVEAIRPFARATGRAGTLGGLGGFGALFDPRAAGFADPILVATTDGVGTKLRVAIETGLHGG